MEYNIIEYNIMVDGRPGGAPYSQLTALALCATLLWREESCKATRQPASAPAATLLSSGSDAFSQLTRVAVHAITPSCPRHHNACSQLTRVKRRCSHRPTLCRLPSPPRAARGRAWRTGTRLLTSCGRGETSWRLLPRALATALAGAEVHHRPYLLTARRR